MAKVKFGMYMTDARGKQGGHVFSKNRYGAYVRTKVTPSNPQTMAQSAVRGLFASITSLWSSLTDLQRKSWNDKVASFATTDVFGDLRNPTGKNLFQKLNQNLINSGQAGINIAPEPMEVPFANLASASVDISDAKMEVRYHGDLTGCQVIFLATPAMSAGTRFVKNKLRQIAVEIGDSDVTVDVWNAYIEKFALPVLGANIYVGVKVVNAVGQASPVETMKLTIVA